MALPYRSALVTGASGMIGGAIVEMLRAEGVDVHAASRDAEKLARLAERTGCQSHALDLTDREAVAARFDGMEIDVLVHNAGLSHTGSILDADPAELDAQIDVNLRAVLQLSRIVVPGMAARNRGHVVIIGSIAGHHNFKGNPAYHASKAGLPMLAGQMRIDLYGKRVRVTEISLGLTRTEIFAKMTKSDFTETFFEGREPMLPEDIADAVRYAVCAPERVNVSHIELVPILQVLGGVETANLDGE